LKAPSLLSSLLCKKMNASTVWEHINTLYHEGKPYIAGFASVVFDAYRMNDETAIQIIDNNAKALAELLNRAVAIYGTRAVAVASGGLFEHYSDIMRAHIGRYSSVELIVSKLPPIYGACRRACVIAGGEMSERFYENFEKTYREMKKQ
jgi:N-acetylglucosamine kinase-like BadF-type ATPase